jgi:succinate dehydrogenase / fumarate reductase, membrane anchor subunit
MVKSVLGVNYQGLRDWMFQRLSAIYMVVYLVGLLVYLVAHPGLAYYEWHGLFVHGWVKVATLLFMLGLLVHTWIGMWTVFTDYVKPFVLRTVLNVVVLLALMAFFFQALLIVWSV